VKALARGVDAAGERRVRDDAPLPDRIDQIVLADHPLAIADQILQQVEHLRHHRRSMTARRLIARLDLPGQGGIGAGLDE
jgi:hypothetical protein